MRGRKYFFMNIEPKPLKYFIVAENMLGIYRNFVMLSIPIKIIVTIRILAELSLAGYIFITSGIIAQDIALFLGSFQAIVLLLVSWYYSQTYVEFVGYLTCNHIAYKSDTKYSGSIEKCITKWVIIIVAYFILLLVTIFIFMYNDIHFMTSSKSPISLVILYKAYTHYRCNLEYAFLYLNLHTISEQLKCITRGVISKISINHLNGPNFETNLDENDAEMLKEMFETWSSTYINIKESSRHLNKVFGIQFTSILFTLVLYYMRVLYMIVALGIADQKRGLYEGIPAFVASIASMLVLFMLIRVAHNLQINAHDLVICLRQALSVRLEPDDTHTYKAIKELARVVISRPISIKAFGSLNVHMPLIPTCLAIMMSYTIIALQFNNIV